MKSIYSSTSDIISDLPSNVAENILMRLPIRDAVRTSILSRKWRYNWAKLPQLVFDQTFCQQENQLSTKNKLVMTIYEVLLLHCGPILKFTLSIPGLESCSEIDRLILFLSRNGIQEFTLRIWSGELHKLPSYLFSCLQLRHLSLYSCVFKPPPTVKGFSRLISLEFREVVFAADIFGSFISSCPLLESLTLESSTSFDNIEIDAPNLKFLRLRGIFKSFYFKNTPLLATVSIALKEVVDEGNLKEGGTNNLINFFGCLPGIENLHMGYYYVKNLAVGNVPERLPTTLSHLKTLELTEIYFGAMDEVSFALCLIRSSPNLQKIKIKVFTSTIAVMEPVLEFLEAQDNSDVSLNHLRHVHMQLISGLRPELEFVKFILAISPVLETMLIELHSGKVAKRGYMILKELTRFRRASPKAEIIYLDPNEDQV